MRKDQTHAERMAALMRELNSPASVAKADKLLETMKHEWLDVLGVRDMAARRHGTNTPAPPMPPVQCTGPQPSNSERSAVETFEDLIERYKAHKAYSTLNYRTRINYDSLLKRIKEDCQNVKLSSLTAEDIRAFHGKWTERGHAIAHSLISALRLLFSFGIDVLKDPQCERLSFVMHRMQFKMPKRRTERLTAEQVDQIRAKAHDMDLHSIALAQAFQFECGLGQKDVIGEWVPLREPGASDVIDQEHGLKWLRGIRWSDIDRKSLVLHVSGKNSIELKSARMVMEEFAILGDLPTDGPIIVCERTDLPWRAHNFRIEWRNVADACKIPKRVFNMDSRPRAKNERANANDSNGYRAPNRDESEKEQTSGDTPHVARAH